MSPPPAMGAESISVWPPDNSPLALTVMVTSPRLTCVTGRREVEAGDTAFISRHPPQVTSASTSAATHTPMPILRVMGGGPWLDTHSGAANLGCSRLSGGQSRLKAGCGQNCPPHIFCVSFLFVLHIGLHFHRGYQRAGLDPFHGDLVRITRQ